MTMPHPIVHHPFSIGLGPLQLTGFGIAILMCFVVGQAVAQLGGFTSPLAGEVDARSASGGG